MSNSSFRIQWQDGNNNKHGSFKGRNERHTDWEELSNFTLSATTYEFYLSVGTGLHYTTFVSLTHDGFARGAKIPDDMHDDTPGEDDGAIALGPMRLSSGTIDVQASYLVSDDPKVVVTWGKGQGNATVELVWKGSSTGWQDGNGRPLPADCTVPVNTDTKVYIKVTDDSQSRSVAAVYEVVPGTSQALIDDWCNLAPPHDSDHTFTLDRPGSASQTTYTVNLFNNMDDAGSLAVR